MRPVATDRSSAGIWVTRPSPTVRRLYFEMASDSGQALLHDADREAAEQVDDDDDDAGDRVALDELAGTVHRTVEVGLGADVRATLAGRVLVDEAGVEVGVDRHLLAGHGVEGEAGADLGDAAGTVGDDQELDDHQDQEDHQTDDQRPADDEVPEGLDHLAGVAVDQDEAGRADVEGEPEERGDQDQRGEDREVERALDLHGDQQDEQPEADVEGDEDVEQDGRQRHDQHDDDAHDAARDRDGRDPLVRRLRRSPAGLAGGQSRGGRHSTFFSRGWCA